MRLILILNAVYFIFVSNLAWSIPSDKIIDTVSGKSWKLKWSRRIGKTTFRQTLIHANGLILVGSNGKFNGYVRRDGLDGVHILDANSGTLVKQLSPPSMGDTDVNGVAVTAQHIFYVTDDDQLVATHWDFKTHFVVTLDADIESAPAVSDFNGDGIMDICLATESGRLTAIDGKTGNEIWKFQTLLKPQWSYPETRSFIASPALVDLNSDGIRDVVIGNRNGDMYAINGKNGNEIWSFRTQHPSGIHSSVFATNDRVYFTESYGVLYAFSKLGREMFRLQVSPENVPHLKSSPVVTPAGTIAIASSWNNQSGVWVYPRRYKPSFIRLGKVSASPVVADFMGDGSYQIGVLSEAGVFVIVDEAGDVVAKFGLKYGGEATPLVTDTDGDGRLEVIFATSDEFISCYETDSSGRVYWSGFRGNPYNTGVVQDTIVEDFPSTHHTAKFAFSSPIHRLNLHDKPGFEYRQLYQETFENSSFIIDEYGIGPVKIGVNIGRLKAILGDSVQFVSTTLGGIWNASALMWNNQIQLYILYPLGQTLRDTDRVSMVVTNNPNYRTKAGIRPNATIEDAVTLYGPATFMYQSQTPLEERIHFKNHTTKEWFVNFGESKIGDYQNPQLFNTTQQYDPKKSIGFIGVRK